MRGQRGFTLLELLVAFVLAGFIAVMLSAGLRSGTRVWEAAETRSSRVASTMDLHDLLRRHLLHAAPLQDPERPSGGVQEIWARADRLILPVADPAQALPGGVYRVTYAVSGEPGDKILALTMAPWGTADAGASTSVLVRGASDIVFSYSAASGDGGWQDSWAGPPPARIRLSVTLSDGTTLPAITAAWGSRRTRENLL